MTPAQLRTVARTMTPDQLDALARLLIEHDPALARLIIDAAIAECPISPSNPPRRLESPDDREARHRALAVRQADQAAQVAAEQAITARARRNRGPR